MSSISTTTGDAAPMQLQDTKPNWFQRSKEKQSKAKQGEAKNGRGQHRSAYTCRWVGAPHNTLVDTVKDNVFEICTALHAQPNTWAGWQTRYLGAEGDPPHVVQEPGGPLVVGRPVVEGLLRVEGYYREKTGGEHLRRGG